MPDFIAGSLRQGLQEFGRRMRGFVTDEAIVAGVESRTSSPVRIPRDGTTLMHPEIEGLFRPAKGPDTPVASSRRRSTASGSPEAVRDYIKRGR